MIDAHLRAPLLLSLFLASCQEPAPVAPTPPVAAVPTASAASSAQAPPTGAQATKADLVRLLCADGEEPCEIRRDRAAGQDGAGHKLRVVSVYRGVDDQGEPQPPSEPDAGPLPLGIEETDRVDTISPALGYSACQRFDYWLLSEGPQGAPRATRLGTMCNEGHGAAGVGEDTLTIGDNKLGFTTVGGSNWRWGRTMELSLSPLRAHTTSFSGYWTMGQNNESRFFSWDEFSGSVNWYSPICLPDGSAPEEDPETVNGERPIYAYASIPAVDFEGDFAGAGWKDTALDRCTLHLNAAGKSAFTIFGKPGEASDASMKVVASRKG
jgi:hypothetical protein